MRRRLTVVAVTTLAAALLSLAQPVTGPATAARTAAPAAGQTPTATPSPASTGASGVAAEAGETVPEAPTVDRIVTDARITESSGLVASTRHAGVVWTHEDSGHPARIFAVDRSGTTVATVTLRGVQAVDWESTTMTRDAQGRSLIALGDIGDNNAVRPEVRVLMLREPTTLKDGRSPVQRILRLRYPDGAVDAETLLADPRTRRLYVVTKGLLGGELYAVPPQAWPAGSDASAESRTWPLTFVAKVDMSLVTDGTFLPDGRLVLRNYGQMAVFADPATTPGSLQLLATMLLPSQTQGESVAVGPGATSLLIGSEGARQPLLRVSMPTGITTPVAGDSATPTATASVNTQRTSSGDLGGVQLPSFLLLVVVAGVVLLLLIFIAVLIALR